MEINGWNTFPCVWCVCGCERGVVCAYVCVACHGLQPVVNMNLKNPEEEHISKIRQHVCAHAVLWRPGQLCGVSSFSFTLVLETELRSQACIIGQQVPSPTLCPVLLASS